MVRPRDTTAPTRTSTGGRLPARGAARRRVRVAAAARRTRRSGSTRARRWARRCARCSTRSRSAGSSSSPTTGSTSRERRSPSSSRASGAPGTRGAPARAARERRARRAPRRHRHDASARSAGTSATRSTSSRPAPIPGFADAMLEVVEREGVDVVLPQSSFDLAGARGAPRPLPGAGARLVAATRSTARTTRPRRTRCCSGSACRRPSSAASNGARRGRRRGRASSATRTGRSASSRSSRRARAASGSSTRPSTARTSCCTSGRARSRCGSRRRVELLPDEGGPELLVMELATGGERTIDGIADGKRVVLGHPKTREAMRAGLAMYFVTLEDEELMEIADKIVARARDRVVLQHPARRRPRDRDQPADLDDRLPGGPEPPLPRREARARRDLGRGARGAPLADPARAGRACATSTRSSSTARSSTPARTRVAERPLRVTHCPVNTAGVPWTNAQALRRRGVDARLVVFERYKLHPEADWSLDRQVAVCCCVGRRRSGRRSRGCCRAPTSSTSTSG